VRHIGLLRTSTGYGHCGEPGRVVLNTPVLVGLFRELQLQVRGVNTAMLECVFRTDLPVRFSTVCNVDEAFVS